MVYSNYEIYDTNGSKHLFLKEAPDDCNLDIRVLGENVIGCTSMPLISVTSFFDIGGFDESLKANQEWDLWIRMLQKHDIIYSPEIAGIKHKSQDGISDNRYRRASGWFSLFIKHANKYKMNPEQFICATGFFYDEMFKKKLFLIGTAIFLTHWLFKITHSKTATRHEN
mgnify:CR=1 FL=1